MAPKVDLRSDTVTVPTPAMREVMARARVGDDVYGEDPSVRALEQAAAALLGHEAALFVPSGTMANQIALKTLTEPGDEVIIGHGSHSWLFEAGAAGLISGVQHSIIDGDGRFRGDQVRERYKDDDHHFAPTRLVSVENTHNFGGGLVWRQSELEEVRDAAQELGMALHLDGARLWNAAEALSVEPRELAKGFDLVCVCLSKGLGAPVGSLVVGSKKRIHRAHRFRKMLGGSMRQAGIIAAGGLYALQHHRARLGADHKRAQQLSKQLTASSYLSVQPTETNIVMFDVEHPNLSAPTLSERALERGVLFHALSPTRVRLVTHLGISDEDVEQALQVIQTCLEL